MFCYRDFISIYLNIIIFLHKIYIFIIKSDTCYIYVIYVNVTLSTKELTYNTIELMYNTIELTYDRIELTL